MTTPGGIRKIADAWPNRSKRVNLHLSPAEVEVWAVTHLSMIREISDALTNAAIEHWLFGGWAVDFAVGEITRPHRDVDFVVWEGELPRITGLLESLGYRARTSQHPAHQLNWEKTARQSRSI